MAERGGRVVAERAATRRAVTVRIAGRDYRVLSDADEGWLQGVAARVDEAMALVRERTETFDSMDVAVLTALNLARELMQLREQGVTRSRGVPLLDPDRLSALIELAEGAVQRRELSA